MTRTILSGALGAAACFLATSALAHVTFEVAEARPNSTYKGTLRLPHGCAGAATHTVRVAVPDGVVGVKPQPKPGWTLTTVKGGPYATPFDDHGTAVTEGVREIVWSGGRLLDEHYDEFVFRGRFAEPLKAGDTAYLPVVQDCEGGSERWVEIPAVGQGAGDLKHPAPAVRIVPAATGGTVAASAPPGSFRLGSLVIEAPWSRATPGGAKVAGGYLRITNRGAEPDRLLGGSAAVAGRFEIHEMSNADGVMRMRPVEGGLTIPPGATVELKPGGFHAMLLDLRQPLKEGDTVEGALVFERAGTVAITYRVGGIGAKDGAGHAHH